MEKRQRSGSSGVTPDARRLAEQSGIPLAAAVRIQRGQTTLAEVVRQLLRREVLQRMLDQGLPVSLAGQVASGQISEERARRIHRAQIHPDYDPRRSCFEGWIASAKPVLIERLDTGSATLTLVGQTTYDFFTRSAEGEEQQVQKHHVKWILEAAQEARLAACLNRDEQVAELNLSSATRCKERLHTTRVFRVGLLDSPHPLRFVFRDGDVLIGRPRWGSKYEVHVRLLDREGREGPEATLFLHALYSLEPHTPVRDGKKGAPPAKKKPATPQPARKKGKKKH